jgi:hypothetical protein
MTRAVRLWVAGSGLAALLVALGVTATSRDTPAVGAGPSELQDPNDSGEDDPNSPDGGDEGEDEEPDDEEDPNSATLE